MGIPVATHSITVRRRTAQASWGDPEGEAVALATGVRAVIGSPEGSEVEGTEGTANLRLTCDEVDGLDHTCEVVDEATDVVYDVVWAVRKPSWLGVHYEAGLQIVTGAAVSR
jgi:hypothetical protein